MDLQLISEWRDRAILVVGDIMVDRFVYGTVERVSPEAPVPVLHQRSETLMLGGAANVARNVVALGGKSLLVGVLGDDSYGDLVAGPLTEEGNIEGHFARVPGHPTTIKSRFISSGQQIMRLDVERRLELDEPTSHRLLEICSGLIDRCSIVVLSDYAKGVLSDWLVRRLIDLARGKGVPVLVDPKSRDIRRYAAASVIKPNSKEAAAIVGYECDTETNAHSAARSICDTADIAGVVLTRGAQGMTIWQPGVLPEPVQVASVALDVFDLSGAGDTVMATLALALAAGADLTGAATLANVAAGVVVAHQGTAVVTPTELAMAVQRQLGLERPKAVDFAEAIAVVEVWRKSGLVVGFTNGCFDLVHAGHVSLLKQARQRCDRLIVAINSDASVRRLKGPSRPVQSEAGRATVLAAMECVDLIMQFDDDTPLRLIQALQPDRLIKGADYAIDQVVGADVVLARGGEVLLIPLVTGSSTTALIERALV